MSAPAPWRRLAPARLDAAAALARSAALLDRLSPGDPPVVAWPEVAPAALIVGRAAGAPAVDWRRCAAEGVTVHQRASGGGPVLWDGALLSLDVLLPRGHPLLPDDVVAAYRWLGEALAAALTSLGARCRAVTVAEARAADPGIAGMTCFGALSPFEVVGPDGRKAVGLAQVRRRGGALLQAGVPLVLDASRLAGLIGGPPGLGAALGRRAAGLAEWLPGITAPEVLAAIEEAVAGRAGAPLRDAPLSPGEEDAAGRLAAGRFAPLAPGRRVAPGTAVDV